MPLFLLFYLLMLAPYSSPSAFVSLFFSSPFPLSFLLILYLSISRLLSLFSHSLFLHFSSLVPQDTSSNDTSSMVTMALLLLFDVIIFYWISLLCYTVLHCVTLRYTVLHRVTLRYTMLHYVTLYYINVLLVAVLGRNQNMLHISVSYNIPKCCSAELQLRAGLICSVLMCWVFMHRWQCMWASPAFKESSCLNTVSHLTYATE